MRIAVTGGSGKLGRHVVRRLRDSGHEVVNLDRGGERWSGWIAVDLTDYGQVVDALGGIQGEQPPVEAIVHLAAIPAPGLHSDVTTFHDNLRATFNVFHAATRLGIDTVVYASSETLLGLPFDTPPPYIPVDEDCTRPESVYSLVKQLEETMAVELCRWHPGLSITALRFSNVMDVEDYAAFPAYDADPMLRKWNLWGYIDGRDGAHEWSPREADAPRLAHLHHREAGGAREGEGRQRDLADEPREDDHREGHDARDGREDDGKAPLAVEGDQANHARCCDHRRGQQGDPG